MTFILPKITSQDFIKRLKKRKFEDLDCIQTTEKLLLKKRGYIFKMPPKDSSVILLVSGGLDSIVAWNLLMHIYRLKVYPLFLNRLSKRTKKEIKAINFFSKYFKKKYPKLFVRPFYFSVYLPPPEVKENVLSAQKLHPKIILENLSLKTMISIYYNAQNLSSYTIPLYGAIYSNMLKNNYNKNIKTIFVAVGGDDGLLASGQTFTALRSTILTMCVATADFSWNFASLFLEKELGHWLNKTEVIKLGHALKLPLEKTWSCYQPKRLQCGNKCLACFDRKKSFKTAKVLDKTKYSPGKLNKALTRFAKIFYSKCNRLFYKISKRTRKEGHEKRSS